MALWTKDGVFSALRDIIVVNELSRLSGIKPTKHLHILHDFLYLP